MIKLYQYRPAFGLPNASPFCMKLETYLRMAGLPFEAPPVSLRELGRAPNGKMPYIEDRGHVLADTTFIIDHLQASYGDRLDGWLSTEQKAVACAFQRLMEENLYWAVAHTRWIGAQGWEKTRAAFFAVLPAPLRWVLPPLARRAMLRQMHGHGMGRHTAEEIAAIGRRDITALADFLGNKPYLMGQEPCSLDATGYAFLANLLWPPVESTLKQHAQTYPQLQAYCERMRARYYA
jgi:glutathione S-transferase